MIRHYGRRPWNNIHATHAATVDDLVDVDNSTASGPQPTGFAVLANAARDFDRLIRDARAAGGRVRALGSAWALTDIAVTDNTLVNTKLLTKCFEVADHHFEPAYDPAKRPYLVVAQCGVSVGQLNGYLEVEAPPGLPRRSLKTSGIGAGQTLAGAVSGNTHGSAVNFGSTPDYVVGLHLVTGTGRSLWIERASAPILNAGFADRLDADLVRDDDVFDAAVVSFGAFGVIAALAIETVDIYDLAFAEVADVPHADLKAKLNAFDPGKPERLYHYEFVFDPYGDKAMEAVATKEPYEPGGPTPRQVWVLRNHYGLGPGDQAARALFALPLPPATKTAFQFKNYRQKCIISNARGTPGEAFTATVTYLEGYNESAIGVSVADAAAMMEISSDVIRRLKLPVMSQVRLVHPSRALLAFTALGPKTAVFEFGLANNATFARFERTLTDELAAAGIGHTLHWSKNAGIDPGRLAAMYGTDRVGRWQAARRTVFGGDADLMRVFENDHLRRAGLA